MKFFGFVFLFLLKWGFPETNYKVANPLQPPTRHVEDSNPFHWNCLHDFSGICRGFSLFSFTNQKVHVFFSQLLVIFGIPPSLDFNSFILLYAPEIFIDFLNMGGGGELGTVFIFLEYSNKILAAVFE